MNPILPEDLDGLMDCNAFVFVPITDLEVPLETLRYIKSNSNGLVVFDAHGPTNGCSIHGERYHNFWIDRDQWLPCIDLLKMNLEEAQCSWFKGEYSAEDLLEVDELTMDELPKFAQHCPDRGVNPTFAFRRRMGTTAALSPTAARHSFAVQRKNWSFARAAAKSGVGTTSTRDNPAVHSA